MKYFGTKFLPVILFTLFFPLTALPQKVVRTKTVVVHAADGWQDSGIVLRPGQFFEIKAFGAWGSGYEVFPTGPEGGNFGTLTNNALVGYIGKNPPKKLDRDCYKSSIVQRIFRIGRGGLFKSGGIEPGDKLWLAMGEWSGCKECSGRVEVLIIIY